ncbi:hypothetical protein CCHR01_18960 [Colletotrichum chrysophilum]|uniref:Uncharacterized protein n=1 Tax=Colletotrichum chrysophilum TaxID=1836956 RepID=A0AAD9A3K2_9PEZI|nr:hypothetical protein CCHR01_18960 [Colletotrichum chrysophilum]
MDDFNVGCPSPSCSLQVPRPRVRAPSSFSVFLVGALAKGPLHFLIFFFTFLPSTSWAGQVLGVSRSLVLKANHWLPASNLRGYFSVSSQSEPFITPFRSAAAPSVLSFRHRSFLCIRTLLVSTNWCPSPAHLCTPAIPPICGSLALCLVLVCQLFPAKSVA